MCGIFGFVGNESEAWNSASARLAIRRLISLSESRGKEAAGVAILLPTQVVMFKRPMNPRQLLRSAEFENFLSEALPEQGPGSRRRAESPEEAPFFSAIAPIGALGHCRLVTNGTQALHQNNQPVVFGGNIGIHNGIITNVAQLSKDGSNGHDRLDSEVLFQRIEQVYEEARDLPRALTRVFGEIEGEASVAFFMNELQSLVLATNSGSLYFSHSNGVFTFASEHHILKSFFGSREIGGPSADIEHLKPGTAVVVPLEDATPRRFAFGDVQPAFPVASSPPIPRPVVDHSKGTTSLKRCSKCILPETYPFIEFDHSGVCNYCHEHVTQRFKGRQALLELLEKHRRSDGKPDCIVAFSGGRDSSYGLHLLKTELGMTPLAFTYDWGLVTDIARRNQARICGKLGIEHVIRAADIPKQRRYLRRNIEAWLKRPELGMIPLFMAGDKFFYKHARDLKKETGIDLVVFCAGNELERTSFKAGFAGVKENNYSNRLFALAPLKKLQLARYYSTQFALNPAYVNSSLVNSFLSFFSTFVGVDDFLYLYNYEPWNEKKINETLIETYNWEISPYSSNTWRIGDGYTAFINYIYCTVAGFSEYDAFRSNQVRDGLLSRDEAMRLAAEDNVPRLEDLDGFARLIGFNLEEVLTRINEMPRLW